MKFICILLILVAFIELSCSKGHKLELKRHETRKEKLIRTGNYAEIRKLQMNKNRARALASRFQGKDIPRRIRAQFYEQSPFTVSVGFGTPSQMFDLVVDLTYGDLWVVDQSCVGHVDCGDYCMKKCTSFVCDGCCNYPIPKTCSYAGNFTSKASTTYSKNGTEWDIYDDTAIGFLGIDTVRLTLVGSSLDVPGTTFVQLNQLADDIIDEHKVSGGLGLGTSGETVDGTTPLFKRAADLGLLETGVFTVWLNERKIVGKPAGILSLDGYDFDNCVSPTNVASLVDKNKSWMFNIGNLGVSAIGNVEAKTAELEFFMDTLNIPANDYYTLTSKLNATYNFRYGGYEVPCNTKLTITIPLKTRSLFFDESDLIEKADDGKTCLLIVDPNYNTEYTGVDVEIGRKFFKKYCASFNVKDGDLEFGEVVME